MGDFDLDPHAMSSSDEELYWDTHSEGPPNRLDKDFTLNTNQAPSQPSDPPPTNAPSHRTSTSAVHSEGMYSLYTDLKRTTNQPPYQPSNPPLATGGSEDTSPNEVLSDPPPISTKVPLDPDIATDKVQDGKNFKKKLEKRIGIPIPKKFICLLHHQVCEPMCIRDVTRKERRCITLYYQNFSPLTDILIEAFCAALSQNPELLHQITRC